MLFFRSTKKNSLFSEQNVVGQYCTKVHIKILFKFIQIFIENMSQVLLLEKNKTKFHFLHILARRPFLHARPSQPGALPGQRRSACQQLPAPRSARGPARSASSAWPSRPLAPAPRPQPGPGPGFLPEPRARLGRFEPTSAPADPNHPSSSDGHERKSQ
jgi:hypothetical protein